MISAPRTECHSMITENWFNSVKWYEFGAESRMYILYVYNKNDDDDSGEVCDRDAMLHTVKCVKLFFVSLWPDR